MIEPLESRIAPAAVSLTYTDLDGDKVKITDSSGTLTAGDLSFIGGGTNGQLMLLDLAAAGFAGKSANITFSVTKAGNGDGFADLGYINGDGNDFGAIKLAGDLGGMIIGSGSATTPAVKGLSARSLGAHGLATQNGVGDLRLTIKGALNSLHVAGDVNEAIIDVSTAAGTNAKIGTVFIGGSLIGGTTDQSGSLIARDGLGMVTIKGGIFGGKGTTSGAVTCTHDVAGVSIGGPVIGAGGLTSGVIFSALGTMGAVKIGGDLAGGTGSFSGRVFGKVEIKSVKLGGSLVGGTGDHSGLIHGDAQLGAISIGGSLLGGSGSASGVGSTSGAVMADGVLGAVKVSGDVRGGDAPTTGLIKGGAGIVSVTIGGSLLGGSSSVSGAILSDGAIGGIKIGRDLRGGDRAANGIGDISLSGYISADRLGAITIGGSVIAGFSAVISVSANSRNAWIEAVHDITSITVKGSVAGAVDAVGRRNNVVFAAGGQAAATPTSDLAIGKITIGGRVERLDVRAGYVFDPTGISQASDGNAQIGPVTVGGDWILSNLVAGVGDRDGNGFGNDDDMLIPGGTISKIASIAIKGSVVGSSAFSSDHYGFVAHTIGAFKAAGFTAKLHATGPLDVVELSPATGDVTVREL